MLERLFVLSGVSLPRRNTAVMLPQWTRNASANTPKPPRFMLDTLMNRADDNPTPMGTLSTPWKPSQASQPGSLHGRHPSPISTPRDAARVTPS